MAKVTAKENFMKIAHNEFPYYIPFYSLMGGSYRDECPQMDAFVSFFPDTAFQGGTDMWGVPYAKPSTGIEAAMPDTRINILEDICDWTKVIKFPEPLDVDIEKAYAENLKRIDRSQTALCFGPHFSPFQELAALMGFEGALLALAEDPEEVAAMLNAMVDHVMPHYLKAYEVFKPDLWHIIDDNASKLSPFFSPTIFNEVFLPVYKRLCEPALRDGVPVIVHDCGNVTPFLEGMYEYGTRVTEPFQEQNDIIKCQEQFKGRMSFIGQWSWGDHIPKNWPDFDEEALRQDVRDTIDRCAANGPYAFSGFPIGVPGDPGVGRAGEVLHDEVYTYGKKFCGYTGDCE